MKKSKLVFVGLLAFAFLIRFIPLIQNKDLMSVENFYSSILAIFVGISILIFIYLISLKVSNSKDSALFSLALASVIPFYSWIIGNCLSSAIGVLFFFSIIYFLSKTKWSRYYLTAIAIPLLYLLLNPAGWIVIPLFIIYYILIRIEHLKKDKLEDYFLYIAIIATFLLTLGFSYSGGIFYIFRIKLLDFLHLNCSLASINKFNFDDLFYLVGPLPVLFGMMGTYLAMKKDDRIALLLFSAIGSSFLVTLLLGNIFAYVLFSLSMACLASFSYLFLKDKIEQSRLTRFTNIILIIITILVLILGASRWLL